MFPGARLVGGAASSAEVTAEIQELVPHRASLRERSRESQLAGVQHGIDGADEHALAHMPAIVANPCDLGASCNAPAHWLYPRFIKNVSDGSTDTRLVDDQLRRLDAVITVKRRAS